MYVALLVIDIHTTFSAPIQTSLLTFLNVLLPQAKAMPWLLILWMVLPLSIPTLPLAPFGVFTKVSSYSTAQHYDVNTIHQYSPKNHPCNTQHEEDIL